MERWSIDYPDDDIADLEWLIGERVIWCATTPSPECIEGLIELLCYWSLDLDRGIAPWRGAFSARPFVPDAEPAYDCESAVGDEQFRSEEHTSELQSRG